VSFAVLSQGIVEICGYEHQPSRSPVQNEGRHQTRDTSDPGDTGTPDLSKLAPFNTPPAAITGVCAFAAAPPIINIAAKEAAGIKTFIERF